MIIMIGINEAYYLVDLKLNWGYFETSHLLFACQYGCFKHRYSIEGKKIKKITCLWFKKNGSNSRKELIKLIKKDFGTSLIGSIVAETFNPEDTSKLLSQYFEPSFTNFEAG